ncbi:hypothetical protein [Brevirhabdus pacifica]|nr:hypothetical protein [Brevirhabdus pacifica]
MTLIFWLEHGVPRQALFDERRFPATGSFDHRKSPRVSGPEVRPQ